MAKAMAAQDHGGHGIEHVGAAVGDLRGSVEEV